ncbi:MAG: osmoprotectant transport system permease protein [Thermoleophilaceae bacterium]|nr:osmoprotectant transport system permease protein [Thermoleophilaceae bacterium]
MYSASIFTFYGDNTSLVLGDMKDTLLLFLAGFGIAVVIAQPLGAWLGHIHRGSFLAINTANIGRALPSLAVIAIFVGVLGIGFWNNVVALVVLAVPVMITNTFIGVDGVERDLTQAARGMGMRGWDVFWRVELPLALPLVFAGMRTAALYVMATTPLAAFTGGSGLGEIIANQASYKFEGVVAASILIAVLAFAADGLFALLQRYATPRALRSGGGGIEAKGSALEAT